MASGKPAAGVFRKRSRYTLVAASNADGSLYVFDAGALGPACGTVRLALYSEKEPEKADTRTVDPGVVRQIWEDFAPYRAAK